ncbi:MAG: hypothetical protein ABSD67_04135 [Terracidiphilus sp.]|jgi:hypothetical protein
MAFLVVTFEKNYGTADIRITPRGCEIDIAARKSIQKYSRIWRGYMWPNLVFPKLKAVNRWNPIKRLVQVRNYKFNFSGTQERRYAFYREWSLTYMRHGALKTP